MFVRSAPTEREKQTSLRSYKYLAPTEPGNFPYVATPFDLPHSFNQFVGFPIAPLGNGINVFAPRSASPPALD
jgi:hypothetical protein